MKQNAMRICCFSLYHVILNLMYVFWTVGQTKHLTIYTKVYLFSHILLQFTDWAIVRLIKPKTTELI